MGSAVISAEHIRAELGRIRDGFSADLEDLQAAGRTWDEQHLRRVRAKWAGPQGELTRLLKNLRHLPKGERPLVGKLANEVKHQVEQRFDGALQRLREQNLLHELEGPRLDVTLPGRSHPVGAAHPLTLVLRDVVRIFQGLGFSVVDGPQVDTHENNFDKLGFPPDHPATDMQDSFFVRHGDGRTLLRTHTSTVQVRHMLTHSPPVAVVAPGAVFRRDDDLTHSPMFFQLEGLLVDEGVSFAHLKGVLLRFVHEYFGKDVGIRLRPSYFPFVEPGAEMDVHCMFCEPWLGDKERTRACRVCKGTGWIEVLGCGMVHPVVFRSVGYDPDRVTGFAFGMGIDRLAMLRYGIGDIRLLYESDVRFLSQF